MDHIGIFIMELDITCSVLSVGISMAWVCVTTLVLRGVAVLLLL